MPRTGHNTTDRVIIDHINEMLSGRGRTLDGRPLFRIVWSSDQFELRSGIFVDRHGPIIIREVKAVREVHKYNYALDHWVLEKMVYLPSNNRIIADEIIGVMAGTYEPLVIFWDANFNAIPVNWPLIEKIFWNLENVRAEHKTASMIEREEREEIEREIKDNEEQIGETQRSDLFAFEDAQFLDSTKQKYWRKDDGNQIQGCVNSGIDTSIFTGGEKAWTNSARVQDSSRGNRGLLSPHN